MSANAENVVEKTNEGSRSVSTVKIKIQEDKAVLSVSVQIHVA